MSFGIIDFLFAIIASLGILYYMRKRKFRSLKNVPEPKSYPIIGSLLEIGSNTTDFLTNIVRITSFVKAPFIKAWFGPWHLYVLTNDPEFIGFLFSSTKHITKCVEYDVLKPWLRNGLITSTGNYWKRHRKLLNPAFGFHLLGNYVNVFNVKSKILIEKLEKNVDNDALNVQPYISNCTLDTICETTMGVNVDAQNKKDNELVKAIMTITYIVVVRMFSLWKRFDALFKYSSYYKVQEQSSEYIHCYAKNLINKRREELLKETDKAMHIMEDDVGMKKREVILNTLLSSTIEGEPLTDIEIEEELYTIISAGFDSISVTLSFAVYELSRNPEIQNKLYSEVKDIFRNNKNYNPTLRDLNDLKYAENVLKETLRLYPAVPYVGRRLKEDVDYKGTIIPKGTTIVVVMYGLHRREDLFPNATKFDPDRFLVPDEIIPFSYVPFSAGPRSCIGQKYAMYECICILSKIIMNFEILPSAVQSDLQLASEIVLTPKNGIHVQLKKRQI